MISNAVGNGHRDFIMLN